MHNIIRNIVLTALLLTSLCGCSSGSKLTYLDKSYTTDTLTVELKVPQLAGLKDKAFQASLNLELEDICGEFLNKFKESAKSTSIPGVFTSETKKYEGSGILSLITQIDYYTQKPHNNSFRITKNINTEDSVEISLNDLFEDDGYIDYINSVLNEICQKNPDNYSDLWAKPVLRDNQDFYITDNSLVIYYPPYELSYYSRGFVEFEIPLSDLVGYMTENYRQAFSKKS